MNELISFLFPKQLLHFLMNLETVDYDEGEVQW